VVDGAFGLFILTFRHIFGVMQCLEKRPLDWRSTLAVATRAMMNSNLSLCI